MNSHITTNISISSEYKLYLSAKLMNSEYSDNISDIKYEKLMLALNEDNEKGQLILAKVFNDKPARLIQWLKLQETVLFEIFHSTNNRDWKFTHEYLLTNTDLKQFAPIYEYSLNIVNAIKKEQADNELAGTSFLTRD